MPSFPVHPAEPTGQPPTPMRRSTRERVASSSGRSSGGSRRNSAQQGIRPGQRVTWDDALKDTIDPLEFPVAPRDVNPNPFGPDAAVRLYEHLDVLSAAPGVLRPGRTAPTQPTPPGCLPALIRRVTCQPAVDAPLTFHTRSGSVHTATRVYRPETDADLRTLLQDARSMQLRVRVVGEALSAAPCVVGEADEVTGALVLQLCNYDEPGHPNLRVDRMTARVWVNAGWTLDLVMRRVQSQYPSMHLPSRCGGPFPSVGALVCSPVLGDSVRFGVLAEAVTAVRVMRADGSVRVLRGDAALDDFRCSLGLLGIVTHAEIQFERLRDMRASHREVTLPMPLPPAVGPGAAGAGGGGAAETLGPVLEALSRAVTPLDASGARWQHYLFHPYAGRVLRVAWSMRAEQPSEAPAIALTARSEDGALVFSRGPARAAAVVLAPRAGPRPPQLSAGARWSAAGCAAAVDFAFSKMRWGLEDPSLYDQDNVFLEYPAATVGMAYSIPLPLGPCPGAGAGAGAGADGGVDLTPLARALAVVAGVAADMLAADAPYKLDLPVSFRFARGSPRALLAPCFVADPEAEGSAEPGGGSGGKGKRTSASDPSASASTSASASAMQAWASAWPEAGAERPLFVIVHVQALAGDGVDPSFVDQSHPACRALADALSKIEAGWREVSPGARAHVTEFFGFADDGHGRMRPHSQAACRAALAPEQRRRLAERARVDDPDKLFWCEWAERLLGGTSAGEASAAVKPQNAQPQGKLAPSDTPQATGKLESAPSG